MNSVKSYRRAFFLLLGSFFLFRMWFITTLPLSGDESYHWEWSRNLAFGYYDHPGLTAYLIRFFTLILGGSTEFSVRMPALVMLSGTAVVCYFFARFVARSRGGTDIDAERAGFFAGLIILVTPIFAMFSMYISTDPPLVFFWALTMYLLCRAFQSGKWLTWIGAGISLGLAMMSKFLGFFILPAVFLFVLISPRDRVWFRRPQPYVAGIVALTVFAPFIWWNATHGWATFMFNFVYRQKSESLELYHLPEFLGVQALVLSPVIFLFVLYCIWRAFKDWRGKRDRFSLFLGLSSLIPFIYFIYESLRQEISPHWPMAGWLGSIIYLACYWAVWENSGNVILKKKVRIAAITVSVVMLALVHVVVHLPPQWINFRWQYSRNQGRIDTAKHAERFGWNELGQKVQKVRDELLAAQDGNGRGVFVICGKYGVASSLAFYTPDQLRTHLWRAKRICGENYRFWDDFSAMRDMDAVYVSKKESRLERALPKLKEHFRQVGEPERLPIFLGDTEVRSFCYVRCYGFNGVEPRFEK